MDPTRRVECKVCRGINDPANAYCAYCGDSLREQGFKATGHRTTGRLVAVGIKRLIFVVVIIAILGGLYYAVNRFLLPGLRADSDEVTTSTTVRVEETTTTTVIPRSDRILAGSDRYGTALAISQTGFPQGASGVVLVPGDTYSEAVCAAPLAAAYGGPVLLVPSDGLGSDLGNEIKRLNPGKVFLVGVSHPTRVKNQVRDILENVSVTTLSGDNAYETAALIAAEIKNKVGKVSKVVIVPSDSFAEAVAAAPLAATNGWPILLAPKEGDVPKVTANAIEDLGANSALVVGTQVKLTLQTVERKVGEDGYETSALLAGYSAAHGLSYAHTILATGEDFPDGLAAGAYAAVDKAILLLAKPDELPAPVLTIFNQNVKLIRNLDFIGLPNLANELAVPGATTTTAKGATTTEGAASTTTR